MLNELNQEQKEAVLHRDGPLLIVAGAGTGKTTVITKRIGWLIQQKLAKSDEILALTFTDKAAFEMEERVDSLLPLGYLDLWISTFHSFCERILKAHALEIGLSNDFILLDHTEQWMLIRRNLDRFHLDYYRPLGNPTRFIHALLDHFSRAKDEMIRPEEYLEFSKKLQLDSDSDRAEDQEMLRIEEVAKAYHIYQQLLLENNALDFGDLINYTLELFDKRTHILETYRKQFKYILIDEFQDTNFAQYELIKKLAYPKNNLTVCADDDQSIYRFRGASTSNVLQFIQEFPESKHVFLVKNYRNQQNVLDMAYNFIQLNNPDRLEYQLNNKKENRVTIDDKKNRKVGRLSKRLVAQKTGKSIIEHIHTKTYQEEALEVVKKILELYNGNWSDFAILVRANSAAGPFIQALSKASIPYQFLASRGLYTQPVILNIISFLKLLDDYHESSALYRILTLPQFEISAQEIPKLTHLSRKKNWSLYESMRKYTGQIQLSENAQKKIERILSLIEKHSSLTKEQSVSRIILSFLEQSGYLQFLKNQNEQQTRDDLRYLNQFYKEVVKFEEESIDKSVKAFLERLDYILDSGDVGTLTPDWEEGPDVVKVMTVHGAKGLEFPYVFLVNLVDKRFPTVERKEPIPLPDELVKEILPEGDIHLQEERRLFYVGMTRAQKGLFFSTAEDYGGTRKKKPSRFLEEIGIVSKVKRPSVKKHTTVIEKHIKDSTISHRSTKRRETYHLPRYFSFTQLKAYETCPLQYKFAHILYIPTKGNAVFSFGRTIHTTMQRFYSLAKDRSKASQVSLFDSGSTGESSYAKKNAKYVKELVSKKELIEIYEKNWIEDWYKSKEQLDQYFKKGKKILREYYDLIPDEQIPPKYVEKDFHLKIGEYTLKGRIDRIDEVEDGKIEIIDYKTGTLRDESTLTPEDKEQLLIYQLAVERVFKEKPKRLSYYYVEENKKVSFLGDENELNTLEKNIISEIDAIRNSDFSPTPSFKCKFCDFNSICEYRWHG